MSSKTDVLSFDEWAKFQGLSLEKDDNGLYVNRHTHYARKGWGAKPEKAEINELKRKLKFKDASIKNLKLQIENKQIDCDISNRKVEELQNKYEAMYRAFTVADDCRKEWYRCYVSIRQREDDLQKNFNNALKTIEIQQRFLDDADGANKIITSQLDELQKRIESAMEMLEYNEYVDSALQALEILKGEETK